MSGLENPKAYADYINDQGGVYGRKIKVIMMDDGYNPTRAMANLQKMTRGRRRV